MAESFPWSSLAKLLPPSPPPHLAWSMQGRAGCRLSFQYFAPLVPPFDCECVLSYCSLMLDVPPPLPAGPSRLC